MLALTNLLVQFSIFIALTAASLHHPAPIVEVNYVTTTTSQLLDANCHFKCYIAKRFLDGVSVMSSGGNGKDEEETSGK